MNRTTAESWQFEMRGGAIVTDPTGDESYFCARLVWMMTAEHTLRFLIYLAGEDVPIVRVVSPSARNVIASSTIEAFQTLVGLVP